MFGVGHSKSLNLSRYIMLKTARKEMCVFTIVQNDKWMIDRWHKYYKQHFDEDDMHILDHNLCGVGCAGHLKSCVVTNLEYDLSFDHEWLRKTVINKQINLLNHYKKVLFAESDEFVVPDPAKYSGLREYIERFDRGLVRTVGHNILHMPNEAPIDITKESIMSQRTHWGRHKSFDKPLLTTMPVEYDIGFHVANNESVQDNSLYLIHLKWMCKEYLLKKNMEICSRKWNDFDWRSERGYEHKATSMDQINQTYSNFGVPKIIPDRFKCVL